MNRLSNLTKALLVGTSLSVAAPVTALAQELPVPQPMWNSEQAGIIADFQSMRVDAGSEALASEADIRSLFSVFPDMIDISFGEFVEQDGGTIATNIELTIGDEKPVGFRIGELRISDLDAGEVAKLTAGETANIGSRIDARDIQLFGIEAYFEQGMDLYVDQVEDAVKALEDMEAAEGDVEMDLDFTVNSYDVSIGQIVINDLTWNETPDEVNAGIDALFASEDLTDEQSIWAFVAPIARFYRSMEVDSMAYYDMTLQADMDFNDEDMSQSMEMDFTLPMVGVSGIERGNTDLTFYTDASYTMNSMMVVEDSDSPIPMDMSGSLPLMMWQDINLSKLFGYLEAQTVPSTDITDLMSLGKGVVYGESVQMGGVDFYSVGKGEFDFSDWHWFVPERIAFSAEDLTYNIDGYLNFVKDTMMSVPEAAEDPEFEEMMTMFDQVATVLGDNGIEELNMDFDFDMAWDAETGNTQFDIMQMMDGFGEFELGFGGVMPDFEEFVATMEEAEAAEEDGGMVEGDPYEALFMENMALTGFDFRIDDAGGLEKLFKLVVEFAQLVPEDEENSELAMFQNSSPEELRGMASGIVRMTGFQAAEVFPPALEYINGFADFLMNGGELSFSLSPEKPVSAESMGEIEGLMEDPDAVVEYFGAEFSYVEPDGKKGQKD